MALVVAAPLLVFGRAAWFDFVAWDDGKHLWFNPYFQPLSWRHLGQLWREPYFSEFVPMLYTWFAGEMLISQRMANGSPFNAAVFHAGNLLLHVGCGVLVFQLLGRLLGDDRAACLGALVFVLHPITTETVAWVSEARGLLATFFGLLAIGHYLDACGLPRSPRQALEANRVSSRRRAVHYALGLGFFGLALVSKPSAVAVPLVAAALDWGFLRRGWVAMAKSLGPWLLLAGALTVLTKLQQGDDTIREWVPVWQRPLVAADALAFYLYKLVVPWGLTLDYGRMPSVAIRHGWPYWTWLVPAALAAGLWWLASRVAWTAAGVFVAGLVPVLGFVPFLFQNISTVADRYVYLSLLGPALLCGWLACRPRSRPVYVAGAVALACWAVIDVRQLSHWRDSDALFDHTLALNPRSLPILDNKIGLLHAAGRLDEALVHARRAVEWGPDREKPHVNLGAVLRSLGQLDESAVVLKRGIAVRPNSLVLRRELAQTLVVQGRYAEAQAVYEQMLEMEPDNVSANLGLASLALETGDMTGAERVYRRIALRPPAAPEWRMVLGDLAAQCHDEDAALAHYQVALSATDDGREVWYRIGLLEQDRGRLEDARAALTQAAHLGKSGVDIDRRMGVLFDLLGQRSKAAKHYRAVLATHPDDRTALNNLAWILATDQIDAERNAAQAVEFAERLRLLDATGRAETLDTLAAAYAEAGRYEEATRMAREAIERARALGNPNMANDIGTRLRVYEQRQPFRQPVAGPQ